KINQDIENTTEGKPFKLALGIRTDKDTGISDQLDRFAKSKEALTYFQIFGDDFPGYPVLQAQLEAVMWAAAHIFVSLAGACDGSIKKIAALGEGGIDDHPEWPPGSGNNIGNVFNWEVSYIKSNPAIDDKTDFFDNDGKQI